MSLHIGKLAPDTTREELQDLFGKFGPLDRCDVLGTYGFVTFVNEQDAVEAIHQCSGKELHGSQIAVDWAKESNRYKPRTSLREISKEDSRCFECNEYGHFARDCKVRLARLGATSGTITPNNGLGTSGSATPVVPSSGTSSGSSTDYAISALPAAVRANPATIRKLVVYFGASQPLGWLLCPMEEANPSLGYLRRLIAEQQVSVPKDYIFLALPDLIPISKPQEDFFSFQDIVKDNGKLFVGSRAALLASLPSPPEPQQPARLSTHPVIPPLQREFGAVAPSPPNGVILSPHSAAREAAHLNLSVASTPNSSGPSSPRFHANTASGISLLGGSVNPSISHTPNRVMNAPPGSAPAALVTAFPGNNPVNPITGTSLHNSGGNSLSNNITNNASHSSSGGSPPNPSLPSTSTTNTTIPTATPLSHQSNNLLSSGPVSVAAPSSSSSSSSQKDSALSSSMLLQQEKIVKDLVSDANESSSSPIARGISPPPSAAHNKNAAYYSFGQKFSPVIAPPGTTGTPAQQSPDMLFGAPPSSLAANGRVQPAVRPVSTPLILSVPIPPSSFPGAPTADFQNVVLHLNPYQNNGEPYVEIPHSQQVEPVSAELRRLGFTRAGGFWSGKLSLIESLKTKYPPRK